MKLRSMYPGYIDAVDNYFNKILPIFVPLQVSVITGNNGRSMFSLLRNDAV